MHYPVFARLSELSSVFPLCRRKNKGENYAAPIARWSRCEGSNFALSLSAICGVLCPAFFYSVVVGVAFFKL